MGRRCERQTGFTLRSYGGEKIPYPIICSRNATDGSPFCDKCQEPQKLRLASLSYERWIKDVLSGLPT